MKSRIIEIIKEMHPNVDVANEEALIDGGILDSMDIVRLVTHLSDEFDVKIRARDIIPANFNSVDAICELIESTLGD